jgi:hypothetical protein
LAGLTSTATRAAPGTSSTQEFQALCHQLSRKKIYTRQVAAWPSEAGDKASPDRVIAEAENNRDRRGRSLGCKHRRGASERDEYGNLSVNKFGRQRW